MMNTRVHLVPILIYFIATLLALLLAFLAFAASPNSPPCPLRSLDLDRGQISPLQRH